jgi:16S rRNA C967 or C1407 C5-methylase (RsmB/RsmF family)/NOL1/NOP2/fmu family ribosome biogenesis protein
VISVDELRSALVTWPFASGELDELATALNAQRRPSLRLRPDFDSACLPWPSDPIPWSSCGRWLSDETRPSQSILYGAGEFYIQDAASLLAIELLDLRPRMRVLDLCASPGGKSTAIAERMVDGLLVANEAVHSRLPPLEFNLARHGSTRSVVTNQDPDRLAALLPEWFDVVLVDAPCSGQSLVGRARQTASAFGTTAIEHCAARQERILDAAAQLLRPGGRLIYSTCTFAIEENERQVERLLESGDGWRVEPHPALERWQSPLSEGCYRLWPHRDGCLGGFAARLVKAGDEPASDGPRRGKAKSNWRPGSWPQELAACGTWREETALRVLEAGPRLMAWPEDMPIDPLLAIAVGGPEIAFRKGQTWFPSYALAMRRDDRFQAAQRIALDTGSACDYLSGQAVPNESRGWGIVTSDSASLGWAKCDGRLAKNHLPKAAWLTFR